MINFLDKALQEKWAHCSWLVIGKGPSFERINDFDIQKYKTISLNHTVEKLKVDLSHITDWDVAVDCQEAIYKNAKFLIMPLYPHFNNRSGDQSLFDLCAKHPFLQRLNDEKRLLWYNSSTARSTLTNTYPVIPVRYFSADAVVALLAYSGIKKIRTIGIDGGAQYSQTFDHLNEKTLLQNGRTSFNAQFAAIAKTLTETGAEMIPLTEDGPIKVYVGSQKEQMLAVKVLEYSIKKNASMSVDVFPMHLSTIDIPMPKDPKNKPRTPFSFQRFIIPELNGFKGKAIYVDSDMQVFTDIRSLWSKDMGDADILSAWEISGSSRKPQYSVMLMDCEKLGWRIAEIVRKLDDNEFSYEEVLHEMKVAKKVSPSIEQAWNSLEKYEEGKTCLLHYTDMNEQPWISRKNSLAGIWISEMRECIKSGFISEDFLKSEIAAGYVRPSLWLQYKRKKLDDVRKSKAARLLDLFFIPPHVRLFKKKKNGPVGSLYCALIKLLIKHW